MKNYKNINFCLGIDPNPTQQNFENFRTALYAHMEILDFYGNNLNDKILKPQLAYFLSFGSKGISLLEEFVSRYNENYTIIIDAKFNDISTTLKAYLHFIFGTLNAHGLTISPFLGEQTLQLAFEECAKKADRKGRVYVLCATSESSKGDLSFIDENWKKTLQACQNLRNTVFSGQEDLNKLIGVVIGANRENILFSDELKSSELSVLSPGLGAQGADWKIISKCAQHPNEITFPVSRGVFAGGNINLEQMKDNLVAIQRYF
ncbi:orotidine-5'-phosphate decarboxylase [Fluviispira multicolorata]|uniref:Orotidine-5'-phosphate decarboxylase n=1 Tax=Fluviispira multicolorata TaxID=2654512 RepID=A0A833JGD2_9BACT|nr:orotidine-5'-phosphate decarboxylase [Fluviispira multicolorata]KAB8032127.1 orotidine-5'-phosphate decarboxylase [Fluviispira multicolorata]